MNPPCTHSAIIPPPARVICPACGEWIENRHAAETVPDGPRFHNPCSQCYHLVTRDIAGPVDILYCIDIKAVVERHGDGIGEVEWGNFEASGAISFSTAERSERLKVAAELAAPAHLAWLSMAGENNARGRFVGWVADYRKRLTDPEPLPAAVEAELRYALAHTLPGEVEGHAVEPGGFRSPTLGCGVPMPRMDGDSKIVAYEPDDRLDELGEELDGFSLNRLPDLGDTP